MAKRLKIKLNRVAESGLFHDSRKDVRLLAKCINEIVDTLNKVIDENNSLYDEIDNLKKELTDKE